MRLLGRQHPVASVSIATSRPEQSARLFGDAMGLGSVLQEQGLFSWSVLVRQLFVVGFSDDMYALGAHTLYLHVSDVFTCERIVRAQGSAAGWAPTAPPGMADAITASPIGNYCFLQSDRGAWVTLISGTVLKVARYSAPPEVDFAEERQRDESKKEL